MTICEFCKSSFTPKKAGQSTCSKRCWAARDRARRRDLEPHRIRNGDPSPIRIDGSSAYVWLRDGIEAVIDIEDLPLVEGKRWRLLPGKRGHSYAITGYSINGDFTSMHRLLLNTPDDKFVDHKDGNGLNNRRGNIRNCTPAQNNANRVTARLGLLKSHFNKQTQNFHAQISYNGKNIKLGSYATEAEAKAAYQGASLALHGEFSPWREDEGQTPTPSTGGHPWNGKL